MKMDYSIVDTFKLIWKYKMGISAVIDEHNLNRTKEYLESVVAFFEKQYACKVNSNIRFHDYGSSTFKGVYSPLEDVIDIYGMKVYDSKELAKTLFHELIHYWQHKIVKTLKVVPLSEFGIPDFCQSDIDYSRQINNIRDVMILFNGVDTTRLEYDDKPHEIEARDRAEKLIVEFEKCQQPLG